MIFKMKYITIFICFLFLFNSYIFSYTMPFSSQENMYIPVNNETYQIHFHGISSITAQKEISNQNYNLSFGYLYYLDSFFLPAFFDIYGNNAFVNRLHSFSNDTAVIRVYDFNNSPVRDIKLNFDIIAKPDNTTGETFTYTLTNDGGRAYFNLAAGNKTGAYIVKVSLENIQTKYLSFTTDEIEIPAKEWRIIGVNKNPQNNNIDFVFNKKPEYIFRWNPTLDMDEINKKYEPVNSVKPGKGYFVIYPEKTILNMQGQFIDDVYVANVHAGWNQLASPYYYVTDWSNMNVLTSDSRVLTLAEAEAENIIVNRIFWYKDNNYYWGPNTDIPNPKLYVWSGFWLYANRDCRIIFNPGFSYTENDKINLAPKLVAGTMDNWQLRVSVNSKNNSDLYNYIGVSDSESIDNNASKISKAPPVIDSLYAGFGIDNILCQDIRQGPIETIEEWILTVSNGNNRDFIIEISDIATFPDEYALYFLNRNNNTYQNLMEDNVVELEQLNNTVQRYSIIAGIPEYVQAELAPPLTKKHSFVRPNPGPNNDGNVIFEYNNVNQDGKLKLTIFDMAGIKVIDRYIDINSNPEEYPWDCKNDAGRRVHTGIYLYILEYKSPAGDSFRLLDKLAIVR